MHAKRLEEPLARKLPERLTARATNDVAQKFIPEIAVNHRGARTPGERGASRQPDPPVDASGLPGLWSWQIGRFARGIGDERSNLCVFQARCMAQEIGHTCLL